MLFRSCLQQTDELVELGLRSLFFLGMYGSNFPAFNFACDLRDTRLPVAMIGSEESGPHEVGELRVFFPLITADAIVTLQSISESGLDEHFVSEQLSLMIVRFCSVPLLTTSFKVVN